MADSPHTPTSWLDAARELAPEAALQVDAVSRQPWTVAVIGRVGVGKSTWIRGVVDQPIPTGLGGVTQQVASYALGGVTILDTPGIDGVQQALRVLGPALEQADAVVWIVDGLQPATASEREVVRLLAADAPRAVLVSRADLIPEDQREAVRERVATLCTASDAALHDLRRERPELPDAVAPREPRPRQLRAERRAIEHAVAALDALPAPPTREVHRHALDAAWRAGVTDVVERVQARIASGSLAEEHGALLALQSLAHVARMPVTAALSADRDRATAHAAHALVLPAPDGEVGTPLGRVASAMGGRQRAERRLRQQAGRWLQEGQLAIADWCLDTPGLDREGRRRDMLRAVLHDARDARERTN